MKDTRPKMHLARYGAESVALCGVTHVGGAAEIAPHDETCPTCLHERVTLRRASNMAARLAPLVGVRTLP